jgi:hypothetical protein
MIRRLLPCPISNMGIRSLSPCLHFALALAFVLLPLFGSTLFGYGRKNMSGRYWDYEVDTYNLFRNGLMTAEFQLSYRQKGVFARKWAWIWDYSYRRYINNKSCNLPLQLQ